jgi:divalent metal cation (Fe/Co/Zn/Cd) transporter
VSVSSPPLQASIVIMCATIVAKFSLYLYCRRVPTPISQALTMDHRNDVISNMGALVFALLAEHFWPPLDPIGAILMSLYIIVGCVSRPLHNAAFVKCCRRVGGWTGVSLRATPPPRGN